MFAGLLPISAAFMLAMLPHLLLKLGVEVHPFLVAPVFTLWVIIVGIVISACIFFRQFVLGAFVIGASLIALLFVYVWYAI